MSQVLRFRVSDSISTQSEVLPRGTEEDRISHTPAASSHLFAFSRMDIRNHGPSHLPGVN